MKSKNVRDVRDCKRRLLHPKPLYSKAFQGFLGNVRDISNIGGRESIYILEYPLSPSLISISYTYKTAICNNNIYLRRKR